MLSFNGLSSNGSFVGLYNGLFVGLFMGLFMGSSKDTFEKVSDYGSFIGLISSGVICLNI